MFLVLVQYVLKYESHELRISIIFTDSLYNLCGYLSRGHNKYHIATTNMDHHFLVVNKHASILNVSRYAAKLYNSHSVPATQPQREI